MSYQETFFSYVANSQPLCQRPSSGALSRHLQDLSTVRRRIDAPSMDQLRAMDSEAKEAALGSMLDDLKVEKDDLAILATSYVEEIVRANVLSREKADKVLKNKHWLVQVKRVRKNVDRCLQLFKVLCDCWTGLEFIPIITFGHMTKETNTKILRQIIQSGAPKDKVMAYDRKNNLAQLARRLHFGVAQRLWLTCGKGYDILRHPSACS